MSDRSPVREVIARALWTDTDWMWDRALQQRRDHYLAKADRVLLALAASSPSEKPSIRRAGLLAIASNAGDRGHVWQTWGLTKESARRRLIRRLRRAEATEAWGWA